jgi:hypothetical protein
MNDSSNPGADFHCAPNSIIKLKGEDLPQPRNGAPTTTDAYVSQLRSDPFAANLVLAVPGISTATGANLIPSGDFSSSTGWTLGTGWTISGGKLNKTTSDNNSAYYTATGLTVGKAYTFSIDVDTVGGSGTMYFYALGVYTTNPTLTTTGTHNISVIANSTSLAFGITGVSGNGSVLDNAVLKQEDAPRDYSADIKGSGTNKTVTPTASSSSGIAYDVPSYYGSSTKMNSGSSDGLLLGWGEGLADYNFGTGDFTMEAWVYTNTTPTRPWWSILRSKDYNDQAGSPNGGIAFYGNGAALHPYDWASGTTTSLYGGNIGSIPNQQWTHVALVRDNGRLLTFCNGVCVGNIANTANYTNNGFEIGQNFPWDGYIQDVRIYKGVAKYKGGFDVPKPYTPIGIESWRTTADTCKNNFATLNPLQTGVNNQDPGEFTDGNLTVTYDNSTNHGTTMCNFGLGKTGNFYAEARVNSLTASGGFSLNIGVSGVGQSDDSGAVSFNEVGTGYRADGGQKRENTTGSGGGSESSYGNSYDVGDIIGIHYNAGTLTFYKNGTSQGVASSNMDDLIGTLTGDLFFACGDLGSGCAGAFTWNFGQNPSFSGTTTAGTNADDSGKGLFKYAPPSGFLALCEDNLPTPAIADPGEHFKTVLYTGSGGSKAITGVGLQPDFVWLKSRTNPSTGIYHTLVDSVRGAPHALFSNSTDVEDSPGGVSSPASVHGGISSFDNNGFSIMSGSSDDFLNNNGTPYVAWCWKAGGAAVSNTDGTITSQVSANQTAGFSIATWTSTGSNDALQTVGHGLDTAPNMIILKNRDAVVNWRVYHSGIPSPNNSLCLNTTEVAFNFFPSVGDDTFGLANSTTTGQSSGASGQDIVAYCWTEIEGFSKFGSYTGNGSADGVFVFTGFRPALVIIKRTDTTSSWAIFDSSRDSANPVERLLRAESSNAEATMTSLVSNPFGDFLSNGFKVRNTSTIDNTSGSSYIFAAFAESPFKYANSK